MQKKVIVKSIGSISALGKTKEEVLKSYQMANHTFTMHSKGKWVGSIPIENDVIPLKREKSNIPFHRLDRSVLLAMYATEMCSIAAKWEGMNDVSINIGSSRGATEIFEKYAQSYYNGEKLGPLSSPLTTSGNVSSWAAQYLGNSNHAFSHSVTCSTGMQSLLNGIAWLKSGMSNRFIAGATEAPLTPFTIAQMEAIKIYSNEKKVPNKALDLEKQKNTFVLSEGAVAIGLELSLDVEGLAEIEGWGYSIEKIDHATSVSKQGLGLQSAMRKALDSAGNPEIDLIIAHAPGTLLGDQSEWNAIHSVFENKIPRVTGNKWKIGHSLATSGLLSIEFAILLLNDEIEDLNPFAKGDKPIKLNRIMVNASGFGGNCTSIILKRKNI